VNHSPAYIVAQYLIGQTLLSNPGDSGDWHVFVGYLPDGDNVDHNAVGCIDTSPVKDGRVMMSGETILHYGVQLLLRASDYNTGYSKAETLMRNLETITEFKVDIGGDTYIIWNVSPATGVVAIGQDDGSKRWEMFSLNFLVTIEEV